MCFLIKIVKEHYPDPTQSADDKAKPEELSKSDKDVVSELVDVDDEIPF